MAAKPFHLGWFLGNSFGVHGWNQPWGGTGGQDWAQPDAAARQDMGVEVDEARQDELASGVEHLRAARRRDLGLDGHDRGIADADVSPSPQVLAGIEHLAAADHEIVDRRARKPPCARRLPG